MALSPQQDSDIKNCQYNLISAYYYSLETTKAYAKYVADAKKAEDQELVAFFQNLMESNRQRSERVKALLRNRL